MRVGLISDVHGNAVALAAVIEQLIREEPDQIVCLGDVAAMGPQPAESLQLVRDLACPVVMGNTDAWLLNPVEVIPEDVGHVRHLAVNVWCEKQVGHHRDFIESFQPTVLIDLGEGIEMLCFHGSPRSNTEEIGAETELAAIKEAIGDTPVTILAGGHTHAQLARRIGGQWLVNPGSIGLTFYKAVTGPRQAGPPWAEFAIVEQHEGHLSINLKATPFNTKLVQEIALESGMPEAAWWANGWAVQDGWE